MSLKRIFACVAAAATLLAACPLFTACRDKNQTAKNEYVLSAAYLGDEIKGTLGYTYRNDGRADRGEVRFNLYANAYREGAKYAPAKKEDKSAYPKGVSYGKTKILACYFNGEKTDFKVCGEDENVLSITVKPTAKGEKGNILIDFRTALPTANTRLGITESTVNLADFFPVACVWDGSQYTECVYSDLGDPYFAESSDYTVSLSVPSEYVAASSGTPDGTIVDGTRTTYRYTLKGGRDYAAVLSKEFGVSVGEAVGATVNVYGSQDFRDKTLPLAEKAISYFSGVFGKFPYGAMAVVETPFYRGGMEYSGLCYVSEGLDEEKTAVSVAHEIAHQWWQSAVGTNQIGEAWLDEGLAEYSTYLFLAENGYGNIAENMLLSAKAGYKSFFDLSSVIGGEKNTAMNRNLKDFSGELEYVAICYDKPLIMFTEFEKSVGRKKAVLRLKKFRAIYDGKIARSDDFIRSVGYGDFFGSYVSGRVVI